MNSWKETGKKKPENDKKGDRRNAGEGIPENAASGITAAGLSGAAFETVSRYGSAQKEHIFAYTGTDYENNVTLKRGGLRHISESKVHPDYENSNLRSQAGYAAENKYAARENASHIIRGDRVRIRHTDTGDSGRYDELRDHLVTRDGRIIGGEQMKFVGDDARQCLNAKLLSKDYEKYLDNDIDITIPEISDEKAMVTLPAYQDVYNAALELRPEIKSNRLSIDAADMQISMAKSGYQPSVSLIANVGTSTATGIGTNWNTQFKNNLNNNIGVSISIPLYDRRQTKSNVEKAQLSKQSSELNLQSAQRQLHSTIEGYWLDAYSAQKKFIAAKTSVESNQASFDLVNEQFKEGLKHLAELNTAKNNLLQSQQDKIQSKYTAVLNTVLLKFYGGESINF